MGEELKPCPFCGGSKLKSGGDDKYVGVWCLTCETQGPNHYITGRDWNTHATTEIPEADIMAVIMPNVPDNGATRGIIADALYALKAGGFKIVRGL